MRTVWNVVRPVELIGAAVAALGMLASACGGSSTPAPAGAAAPPRIAKPTLDPAVVAATKTMAAGVPIGDAAAPVETRFDLAMVPVPGEPFLVHAAVLPGAPTPLLRLDVTATEGLLVLSPEAQITREKVTAGSAVALEIRAQSPESGSRVLYVKATLELPDGPQARTFAFPILVGPSQAPVPAPAKAPAPAKSTR